MLDVVRPYYIWCRYGSLAHQDQKGKTLPIRAVREITRGNGKPKVISQVYIGSPEKVAAIARGGDINIVKLKVEEFGVLFVAAQIDQDVDLCTIIDKVIAPADRETAPSVGEYFLS